MGGDLSIMVAMGLGKVRRFKASSTLLLGSGLFFAAFIIFSIFAINGYFSVQRENAELRKQLAALEQLENLSHRKIYRMQQKVALLEDYIRLLEKPAQKAKPEAYSEPLLFAEKPVQQEKAVDTPKMPPVITARKKTALPVVTVNPPKGTEKEKTSVSEGPGKAQVTAEKQKAPEEVRPEKAWKTAKPVVSVQALKFQRRNTRLTVSFKLAKTASDAIPLRGYLHMIIMDRNLDPPQVRTFPHEVLKDGVPVNYKRGQLFVIKHFRVVRGKFFLGGTKESPDSVRVFVYDKDGVLLLEDELQLKKEA